MIKKKKNDYFVLFKGVRLNTRDANVVGICIIFGMVGAAIMAFLHVKNIFIVLVVLLACILTGYLFGTKIFKK